MSNNEEILILLAIENANIINLLERKKKIEKKRRKVWVRDYFNRKNAIIAFEKNLSTMKMAGKQLFTIFFLNF